MDLREAWKKYGNGDSISDEELNAMIKQAEAAMPYLMARCPDYRLAHKDTAITLASLRGYQQARKEKP